MTTNIEHPHSYFLRAAAPAPTCHPRQVACEAQKVYVGLLHAAHLWETDTGAELDLWLIEGQETLWRGRPVSGCTSSYPFYVHGPPDLGLHDLIVLYPGDQCYPLGRYITVMPLAHLTPDLGATTPTRGRQP